MIETPFLQFWRTYAAALPLGQAIALYRLPTKA